MLFIINSLFNSNKHIIKTRNKYELIVLNSYLKKVTNLLRGLCILFYYKIAANILLCSLKCIYVMIKKKIKTILNVPTNVFNLITRFKTFMKQKLYAKTYFTIT